MKHQNTRNGVLALVGLAALTVYILACTTSFSPDDTKVVYPAFDGPSGRLGVAVYYRETGRAETLFLPVDLNGGNTNELKMPVLRPQWLADGRRVLVAWSTDRDLAFALVPCGVSGAVKLFFGLPNGGDPGASLMFPVPVVGERAFVVESEKAILRVDLKSGEMVRHEFQGDKSGLSLWADPADKDVFYLEGKENGVFGRLNPRSFEQTPLISFTNKMTDGSFFACDERGRRVAFVEEAKPETRVVVLENGKAVFTRPLDVPGGKLTFGNGVFSRKGDALLGGYHFIPEGQTNSSFGLFELPLNRDPIRLTTLIAAVHTTDGSAAFYFQIGISHDGKTAAGSSAYLACAAQDFKAEDCALFFVDLRDAKRKVTKVSIPLPTNRPSSFK